MIAKQKFSCAASNFSQRERETEKPLIATITRRNFKTHYLKQNLFSITADTECRSPQCIVSFIISNFHLVIGLQNKCDKSLTSQVRSIQGLCRK